MDNFQRAAAEIVKGEIKLQEDFNFKNFENKF